MQALRVPAAMTAALLGGLMATAAQAADIPARRGALPPTPIFTQAPAFTWTGFYIGANAGFAFAGQHRNSVTVTPPGTGVSDIGGGRRGGGFSGGMQAGFNWQAGNLVLGIETDIQALLNGRRHLGPATLPDGTIATGRSDGAWYGTLRPRIGYALDRALVYATAGLAYGAQKHSIATVDPVGDSALLRANANKLGWTAGAGVEYALSRNWSTKLEYQYVAFQPDRLTGAVFTPAGVATGATVSHRNENSFHVLKTGINYRF